MSEHSPGPWKARCIDDERGRPDWLVFFPNGEDASVLTEANARLIAAAPELLAIVRDCLAQDCLTNACGQDHHARARKLLAALDGAPASEPAAGEASR